MTRDELVSIAERTGLGKHIARNDRATIRNWLALAAPELEAFAAGIREAERERACRLVFGLTDSDNAAQRIADAIRESGERI